MPLEFAVFSPDAEKVVTVARDGLVQSWDAVAGKLAQTLVDEGRVDGMDGMDGFSDENHRIFRGLDGFRNAEFQESAGSMI